MPDEHEKLRVVGGLAALGDTESMSLNEKAYQLIRLDILTFRLKPGEKTSEQLLAARYGLGKSPIRAALPRLVQEGFVEKSTERGTFVAPLTLRATKEMIRRVLAKRRLAHGEDADMVELCYTSADFREGVDAFLAKRKPNWRGV